ncbi:DUF4436 family protein [Streptomyces sp. NPDC089919]|uniref:DUF4436 family protein n=1 Tax=Streptomyces sp. NPDC089919 TaxID=3155188 RepID=UPI003435841E
MSPPTQATRFARRLLPLAAILLAIAVGAGLYVNEREVRGRTYSTGARQDGGVTVDAAIQKVDPVTREMTLRVLVQPQGRLRAAGDPFTPAVDLRVTSSSLIQGDFRLKAGQQVSYQDMKVSLSGATVSDYPFDEYATNIGFTARAGNQDTPVPVLFALRDEDAAFKPSVTKKYAEPSFTGFDLAITRSRGTFVLIWFMTAVMWGLALAVLGATWVIISQRRGLVWPAMGWMAATLFALAGFRGTAPGGPPMGSLLDYTSFLWAEAIISACLIAVAASGIHSETQPADEAVDDDPEAAAATRPRAPRLD